MSTDLKHIISELLHSSSHFNVNDILVNIQRNDKKILFSSVLKFQLTDFPNKILREANSNYKETGINSLCRMQGTIKIKKNEAEVVSPLFLTSIGHRVDRVRNEVVFEEEENGLFINPFVINQLKSFGIALVVSDKNENFQDTWVDHLKGQGFEVELQTIGIGNFHHHRYELLKELEELVSVTNYSAPLKQVLLGEKSSSKLNLSNQLLFPADIDHKSVFNRLKKENIIVQGPPGTGKSQLLTNVIAKALDQELLTLVVSEKHAALEVIEKKLAEYHLDKLCSIATSEKSSKSFLTRLQQNWKFFESLVVQNSNPVYLANNFLDNLQLTLDILNQENLIGGVSYQEFITESPNLDSEITFIGLVPDISTFNDNKEIIQLIYKSELADLLSKIKFSYLVSGEFNSIDAILKKLKSELDDLKGSFEINYWSDVEKAMKTASDIQIFENETFKKYGEVLRPNSKEQKKFQRLYKSYLKLIATPPEINDSNWKQVPSKLELEYLIDLNMSGSFMAKLKFRRRWKQLSILPIELAQKAISQELDKIEFNIKLSQFKVKFCDLNIENPEVNAKIINQFIPLFSADKWDLYESIVPALRDKITLSHRKIEWVYNTIKKIFKLQSGDHLLSVIHLTQQNLSKLIEHQIPLQQLDRSSYNLIGSAKNFDGFKQLIFNHHWVNFKQQFPQFSNFKPSDLSNKIEKVIEQEKEDSQIFANALIDSVALRFKKANDLLSTPASKLSEKQKEYKKALRKGKSILVKEFAKSRRHPSLRELFNSDAKYWINILQPIWLSNPAELSHCFPMTDNLFDLVIFDEASQIPIENSLGALQRSTRVLVAGDEKQMGPTSYFKAVNSEVTSLLHQASFYFSEEQLTHHYRSENPKLIQFSNENIYRNLLTSYPSAVEEDAPLQHYFIEGGTYKDRKNETEAQKVAEKIEALVAQKKQIGIVAFSQEQLNCIWDKLNDQTRDTLLSKIENNTAFFKPLEKVQGEECDYLVISFGFAKNPEGEFQHRFGPMNQEQGRNRLNVLLTRAKKQINFFTSIRSEDFKMSSNESVELLRKWVNFSEQVQKDKNSSFPHSLNPTIVNNNITFEHIQKYFLEATELVNLHRVLSNRGWKCHYK